MGPVSIVIDTALVCEAREITIHTIPTGTRKRTRIKNSVYEDSGEPTQEDYG
jgi:hypothetical protein